MISPQLACSPEAPVTMLDGGAFDGAKALAQSSLALPPLPFRCFNHGKSMGKYGEKPL